MNLSPWGAGCCSALGALSSPVPGGCLQAKPYSVTLLLVHYGEPGRFPGRTPNPGRTGSDPLLHPPIQSEGAVSLSALRRSEDRDSLPPAARPKATVKPSATKTKLGGGG